MSCGVLYSAPSSAPAGRRIRNPPLSAISTPFLHNNNNNNNNNKLLSYSRKFHHQIWATKSQQQSEKVVVDDFFPVRDPLDSTGIGVEVEPTPDTFEGWVIKFEHFLNYILTESVIRILDVLYRDRNYARFYVLETIARVPYFAFISVLHLYESCGWWRRADYLKVHFAESWNELHHLLIMEELGGNKQWFDRFLSQHIAIFYYFMTVIMYMVSPRMAYHFSECVERHAYSTYDLFLKLQGDELKKMPASEVAIRYYMDEDLYMFDEFQTSRAPDTRRPKIENLYDVFFNIREDEAEHCKTMKACQIHGNLRSPHTLVNIEDESSCVLPEADCEGIVDCIKKSFTLKP